MRNAASVGSRSCGDDRDRAVGGVDVGNLGALNNHSVELGAAFKF